MKEHKFYEGSVVKIDLTVMFGEGKEPTPEEFEEKYLKRCEYDNQEKYISILEEMLSEDTVIQYLKNRPSSILNDDEFLNGFPERKVTLNGNFSSIFRQKLNKNIASCNGGFLCLRLSL